MSQQSFVDCYEGKQRTVYQKALDSLSVTSLTHKDAKVVTFIKTEKVNFTAKANPVPRGICPRRPRYHVSLGPTIRTIEKEQYKRIDKVFGSKTVFKSMNAYTRGKMLKEKWDKFTKPVAIGLDASRFDQHVSTQALQWEHANYKRYNRSKQFAWLLDQQLKNRCTYYGRTATVSYVTEGGRMSGDMNTSLGNVTLMCGMVYSYMDHVGVAKYELVNDGDDCVLIIEVEDAPTVEQTLYGWFNDMGFTMKVEPRATVFERIEFCQSNPVWTPDGYIMVRHPTTGLAKQCVSIKPLTGDKLMRRWLSAVGQGGTTLTGGVPIWQEFFKHCFNSAKGAKPLANDPTQRTGFERLARGMKREYGPVHPRTRYSFYLAFGITPAEQLARENQIAQTPLTTWTDKLADKSYVHSVGCLT